MLSSKLSVVYLFKRAVKCNLCVIAPFILHSKLVSSWLCYWKGWNYRWLFLIYSSCLNDLSASPYRTGSITWRRRKNTTHSALLQMTGSEVKPTLTWQVNGTSTFYGLIQMLANVQLEPDTLSPFYILLKINSKSHPFSMDNLTWRHAYWRHALNVQWSIKVQ